jgi:hypothetical protein
MDVPLKIYALLASLQIKHDLSHPGQNTFTIVWLCLVTHSLWIKPTDALNSNFIGIKTLYVSGSLFVHHQEFLAYVGFDTFYAAVSTICTGSRMELRTNKIGIQCICWFYLQGNWLISYVMFSNSHSFKSISLKYSYCSQLANY